MTGHGGNIHLAARETGVAVSGILDFSASINPLGMPASAARAIAGSMADLVHYPEPFADQLAEYIAVMHGIEAGTVLCGNGSTELIYLVARALAPRTVLIPAPTFSEYERACGLIAGSRCAGFMLAEQKNFDVDPDEFIGAMQGCDMAFLCNPNNPTGRLMSREAIRAIAAAAERSSCYLVVDEAFIDFTPQDSVLQDVAGMTHLIVLRSLTKFYALAGLRIGYGVFPSALIKKMRDQKEPWTVNTLAQQAAIASLDDKQYQAKTMDAMRDEKQFLEQELQRLGITYFPSAPNYYLLKLNNAPAAIAGLREKGILVRDCSNFAGLDETYIRVAVRSRRENEALLKGLAACAA